jgi:hypothetical protein
MDRLREDVAAAGLCVTGEIGWFLKTLPNAMMLDFDESLLRALYDVSDELSPRLLANIAVVAEV